MYHASRGLSSDLSGKFLHDSPSKSISRINAGSPYTDVMPVCIQSGVGFYCPARKETEGVAKAVLKETGTAER
jgi:hypothetical protein